MTPEFIEKLKLKKEFYDSWAKGKSFSSSRLVHYCGVDSPNCIDVHIDDIWAQIEGCLAEGFLVNWSENNNVVYICVQEPDCPIPSWGKVYAEEAIENVDAILKNAAF